MPDRLLLDKKKVIENLIFLLTAEPSLFMGQKKTISERFFFRRNRLSEVLEHLVRKFGKNRGVSYQRDLDQKSPREEIQTKASLGQTDARRVQTCLQTQTSSGMETFMDDCATAVAAVLAATRRRKQRIKTSLGENSFWGCSARNNMSHQDMTIYYM